MRKIENKNDLNLYIEEHKNSYLAKEVDKYFSELKGKICMKFLVNHDKVGDVNSFLEFKKRVNLNLFKNLLNQSLSFCKVSMSIIREYAELVDWDLVSKHQVLSEEFIIEFKEDVNWNYIFLYQNISEEFMKDNFYRIKLISINEHNKILTRDSYITNSSITIGSTTTITSGSISMNPGTTLISNGQNFL